MWTLVLGLPLGILYSTFTFPEFSWQISFLTLILAAICVGLILFMGPGEWRAPLLRRHLVLMLVGLLLGATLGGGLLHRVQPLPLQQGAHYYLTGKVSGLAKPGKYATRYLVQLSCLGRDQENCDLFENHIPLIWPVLVEVTLSERAMTLLPGQKVSLQVRHKVLDRPASPGGFNFENWMLVNHIVARMSHVRHTEINASVDSGSVIGGLRWAFAQQLSSQQVPGRWSGLNANAILLALITGDRHMLTSSHWALFNRTGTSHLIAISGLHIGLVVMFLIQLTLPLFKRTHALTNLLPAIHCALIVGWAGALFYAALAGFSLPTQRALIMVTVFTLATVLGRARQLWSALGLAFCLVLLWDPVAGRSLGFWLSFGAVFLILWSIGGEVVRRTVAQRWFTVQLSLFAGLAPILLWSVHSVSLVSFITNLIAIPVVGFVIVPLCLVWAGLWTVFGDQVAFLLQAAAVITDLVMWLLQELAYLRYSTWQVGIRSLSSMLLALVGVAWLMSPGLPGRLWGGVLMLPILLPQVQGIGMYVMGPTSGRVVLHEQGKMLSISRSHWPQPIADWQSGLLENWGVHLPDNVPLVGSKTLWLDPGVVITELSIQQGKLATRVVSSVHYHSLCGLTAQYSDLKLRVWTAQAAGEHCVLEFHWGQSRWLYWPVAKLAAQQALVKNLAGEQFTGIILDLGGGRHLDSGVFNLLANNGTLVTTKRIPELALAEKPVRGIRLHTVASDGYFYANEVGDWAEDSDVSAKM